MLIMHRLQLIIQFVSNSAYLHVKAVVVSRVYSTSLKHFTNLNSLLLYYRLTPPGASLYQSSVGIKQLPCSLAAFVPLTIHTLALLGRFTMCVIEQERLDCKRCKRTD